MEINDSKIDEINREVEQIAEDLVNHIKKLFPADLHLDYSEKSLKTADAIIEKLRSEGSDESVAENEIIGIGAYLGQIIKRNHGGFWTTPELAKFPKDSATFSVVFMLPNGVSCNPLGRVLKYFKYGSQYSLTKFYELTTIIPR